jgi:DNA polymerase III delta prime subunit
MSVSHYNDLWVERYRPLKLSDILLSKETRSHFESLNEDIPNMLFYGSPGTGKTTLAKIIVKDILKCQYLYINASDENGIDTIRNKVISFAQTRSMDGNKKVVILDEFCGTTGDAQRILRNVMEEYSESTRFILTSNYLNKIIEPIKSRCLLFKLTPEENAVLVRCVEILIKEKVTIDESQKKLLPKFVNERYPDLRRIINDLQKFSVSGILQIQEENTSLNFANSLFKKLIDKESVLELRRVVIENEKLFNNDFQQLMKSLFDLIYESSVQDIKKKMLLLDLGEHMYRDNFVLDHEINFHCCLIAMENSLKS